MKRKLLSALLTFAIALTAVGCGEIDDNTADNESKDNSSAQTESTENNFTADSSFAGDDSSADSRSTPDDSSTDSGVLELEIKSYSGDQVPELKSVITATLNGAAGEFSEFEKVFDPDILIEAQLRSLVESEDKRQELRAQYDDESRNMTVRQNYELLHSTISGVKFESEPTDMKIQTITGELDDSILFDLNFDIESSAGKMTFIGKAYHIDGKWGAVFEPGEHKSEEELMNGTNEGEKSE